MNANDAATLDWIRNEGYSKKNEGCVLYELPPTKMIDCCISFIDLK